MARDGEQAQKGPVGHGPRWGKPPTAEMLDPVGHGSQRNAQSTAGGNDMVGHGDRLQRERHRCSDGGACSPATALMATCVEHCLRLSSELVVLPRGWSNSLVGHKDLVDKTGWEKKVD